MIVLYKVEYLPEDLITLRQVKITQKYQKTYWGLKRVDIIFYRKFKENDAEITRILNEKMDLKDRIPE